MKEPEYSSSLGNDYTIDFWNSFSLLNQVKWKPYIYFGGPQVCESFLQLLLLLCSLFHISVGSE